MFELIKSGAKTGVKAVVAIIVVMMIMIALIIGAVIIFDDGSTTEVIWTDGDFSERTSTVYIDTKVENTGNVEKEVIATCIVDAEGEDIYGERRMIVPAEGTNKETVVVDDIPEGRDGLRIITHECSVEEV